VVVAPCGAVLQGSPIAARSKPRTRNETRAGEVSGEVSGPGRTATLHTVRAKPLAWNAVSYGAGALATLVTRRVLVTVWGARHDEPAPEGPGAVRAPLPEALTWAIAVGAGLAVVRMLAIRSAARMWEVATHEPPPVAEA
jgi:hypothetical protein